MKNIKNVSIEKSCFECSLFELEQFSPYKDKQTTFDVPKRPNSPFGRFVADRVKAGERITVQTKTLAKEWKTLNESEKEGYYAKYDADMDKYKAEMDKCIEVVTNLTDQVKEEIKKVNSLKDELNLLQFDKPKTITSYQIFAQEKSPEESSASITKAWKSMSLSKKKPYYKISEKQNKLERDKWHKIVAEDGRSEKIEELEKAIIKLHGSDALKKEHMKKVKAVIAILKNEQMKEEKAEITLKNEQMKKERAEIERELEELTKYLPKHVNAYAYFVLEKCPYTSGVASSTLKYLDMAWRVQSAAERQSYAEQVQQTKLDVQKWLQNFRNMSFAKHQAKIRNINN